MALAVKASLSYWSMRSISALSSVKDIRSSTMLLISYYFSVVTFSLGVKSERRLLKEVEDVIPLVFKSVRC